MFQLTAQRPSHPAEAVRTEHVVRIRPMQRLLAFANRSIDDVVNCPVARRHVIFYYRVGREIERQGEIVDLERQWNPTRARS